LRQFPNQKLVTSTIPKITNLYPSFFSNDEFAPVRRDNISVFNPLVAKDCDVKVAIQQAGYEVSVLFRTPMPMVGFASHTPDEVFALLPRRNKTYTKPVWQ
jgi:hypothetical protein